MCNLINLPKKKSGFSKFLEGDRLYRCSGYGTVFIRAFFCFCLLFFDLALEGSLRSDEGENFGRPRKVVVFGKWVADP